MLVLMAVFSESSSGGDAEENIVACDDTVAAVADNHDNRHRIIKEDSKKENAEKGQIDDHSNPAKGTMCKENLEEIELRREACKDKEQKICDIFEGKSDTLREVEMRVKVGEVEEQAVRAVREASTVVAGASPPLLNHRYMLLEQEFKALANSLLEALTHKELERKDLLFLII